MGISYLKSQPMKMYKIYSKTLDMIGMIWAYHIMGYYNQQSEIACSKMENTLLYVFFKQNIIFQTTQF